MQTVYQSPINPDQITFSLRDMVDTDLSRLRIAVAYVTKHGCQKFISNIEAKLGIDAICSIPKLMATSFDFGHTEPAALKFWMNLPNAEVRIANIQRKNGALSLTSGSTNFHPKVYIFDYPDRVAALIGSANLTRRALTVNTEAAFASPLANPQVINTLWQGSWEFAEQLTGALLNEYGAVRRGRPVPMMDSAITSLDLATVTQRRLIDAIDQGLKPSQFQCFWIQAGSMTSGGSRNQLELPRGANAFFGFNFKKYTPKHVIIGYPTLIAGTYQWTDRSLTWHAGGGQNTMERLNLPTIAQGGFDYMNTAILFRHTEHGFEINVTLWGSDQANAWVNASANRGTIYCTGLGHNARMCGLF